MISNKNLIDFFEKILAITPINSVGRYLDLTKLSLVYKQMYTIFTPDHHPQVLAPNILGIAGSSCIVYTIKINICICIQIPQYFVSICKIHIYLRIFKVFFTRLLRYHMYYDK